ncbi:MAG: cyclic nucleotide-binding domain-containing protein [Pseudomonadota bacterium]
MRGVSTDAAALFASADQTAEFILLLGVAMIAGLAQRYLRACFWRPNDDERAFLSEHMPSLDRASARRLTQAGEWRDVAPGRVLAREGEASDNLIFLASGAVEATREGAVVQIYPPQSFVGEQSRLTGEAANATCEVVSEARCFLVRADALRRLTKGDARIRHALDRALVQDGLRKRMAADGRQGMRVEDDATAALARVTWRDRRVFALPAFG